MNARFRGTFLAIAVLAMIVSEMSAQSVTDAEAKMTSPREFLLSKEAIDAGIDGNMTVRLTLDNTGKVKQIWILAGPAWPCGSEPKYVEDVREAVKDNIRASGFSPAMKNGKPVGADLIMRFAIGDAYRRALQMREAEEAVRRGENPKLIAGGVLTGKALRLPRPAYPPELGARRIGGPVPVEVVFDEQGNVVLAGAVGGHPLLHNAARDAACAAKFAPVQLSGKPVKVHGVITYIFSL
jgi:TonB family protein